MRRSYITTYFAGLAFLALIFDTKTALNGASEGIQLCLQTVIPSLFVFIFLSIVLTGPLSKQCFAIAKPLYRLLRIPRGAEFLLLIGLIGGYPVGAQSVAEATRTGIISGKSGRRLLAFCSNAGPSFIFGIGIHLFEDKWMCWALWGVHIISALTVGYLTQGSDDRIHAVTQASNLNMTQALQKAIRVMANICGWVVIFRVLIAFCERWFLWLLPNWAQCLFCGILELTNGCYRLTQIGNQQMRFILCALFLGFGGVCVAMQTYSVTDGVDTSLYLPGKILQAVISTLLAGAVISQEIRPLCISILAILFASAYFYRKNQQKGIAFRTFALYNGAKEKRR